MFRKLSDDEIAAGNAARKAEFDALPLIEQIRLVVREEVYKVVSERLSWDKMSEAERMRKVQRDWHEQGQNTYPGA